MKLSLCVVNYYSEEDLLRFLRSVEDYRPQYLYEVIVVNNGSSHEHLQNYLREKIGDQVRVISPRKNRGFGRAQNLAVKHARGEYVFLCNPDLQLEDHSLQRLLDFAERQDNLGVVGPKLVHPDGVVQASCRRFPRFGDLMLKRLGMGKWFPKRVGHYLMQDLSEDEVTPVDWMVGAALLMRRDRFEELGGFDERFFLFFEDTDLCRRAQQAGFEVCYNPRAVMVHGKERLSERGFWPFRRVFWIHLSSALKYYWKWKG